MKPGCTRYDAQIFLMGNVAEAKCPELKRNLKHVVSRGERKPQKAILKEDEFHKKFDRFCVDIGGSDESETDRPFSRKRAVEVETGGNL